jgi:hypothetical protein
VKAGRPAAWLRGPLLAVAVFTTACDDGGPVGFDPVVTNRADFFELQAPDLSNVTTITEYVWTNTGNLANVTQTSTLASGTATLDLLDGAGNVVYSRSLTNAGTFPTLQGTAGPWVIRLALTGVYGTVSFQARKA